MASKRGSSTPIAARRAAAAGPSSDENAKSARGAATKSSMIAKRPSVVATGSAWPASTTIQMASSRTNRRMSAMTWPLGVSSADRQPPPTAVPATLPVTMPFRKRTRSAPVATASSRPVSLRRTASRARAPTSLVRVTFSS